MRISDAIPKYLRYLKSIGFVVHTIATIRGDLNAFYKYLGNDGVYRVEEINFDILKDYQEELAFYLTPKGKPLTIRTQINKLCNIRGFTKYLKDHDYLLNDPGTRLRLPRHPKRLPRIILSGNEIEKLLQAPDTRTNRGYRNRVILEILYNTAIRRAEVSNIKLSDLDLKTGFTLIQSGKGDKDRVVPITKSVCEMIHNYIVAVRPEFLQNNKDDGYLFLNRWGQRMKPAAVYQVVKRCLDLANIKKKASTHTFRHSCATHMLRNGAPIRHIQEMLGHESLDSTQVYTRVTINDLKEVHAKYHPSGNG